jgi:hypothetical protein
MRDITISGTKIYPILGNSAVEISVDDESYGFSNHLWICVSFTRGCVDESGAFVMIDSPSIIPILACDDMLHEGKFESYEFHVNRIRERVFADGDRLSRLYWCDGKEEGEYYADIDELHRSLESILRD